MPGLRFICRERAGRSLIFESPRADFPGWFTSVFLLRVYQMLNAGSAVKTFVPRPGSPFAMWCEDKALRKHLDRHPLHNRGLLYDVTVRIQVVRWKGSRAPLMWVEKIDVSTGLLIRQLKDMGI